MLVPPNRDAFSCMAGTRLKISWGVQIYCPTCLALVGADILQYLAASLLQYMTAYESVVLGHITSYFRTCARRVLLLHHCLIRELAR